MAKALTVRFRIDFANDRSIGVGKIELLENKRKLPDAE